MCVVKSSNLRVTAVGSHLFAETHHVLARLAAALSWKIEFNVMAKYPKPYSDQDVPVPTPLKLSLPIWAPETDVVHAIGGGETAIKLAHLLDERIPLIVSFVGAVDLTRQLQSPHLTDGYRRLFKRAAMVTCPTAASADQLVQRGASRSKTLVLQQCLPLEKYPSVLPQRAWSVAVVARDLPRKGHERALNVLQRCICVRRALVVGSAPTGQIDGIEFRPALAHDLLIKVLASTGALLQTADWNGPEIDTLPIVVLEALAVGVPVVSTPLPGVVSLRDRFPQAVRVSTDIGELAALVDEVLSAPPVDALLRCRAVVLSEYVLSHTAGELLQMYHRFGG